MKNEAKQSKPLMNYKTKYLTTQKLEKHSTEKLKKQKIALDIKAKQANYKLQQQKAYANEDLKLAKFEFEKQKWDYKVQQDIIKQQQKERNQKKGWSALFVGLASVLAVPICSTIFLIILFNCLL